MQICRAARQVNDFPGMHSGPFRKHNMKLTKINLAEPFEKILAAVFALPATGNASYAEARASANRTTDARRSSELEEVTRAIYEAANGRQVGTQIGLIPIAPPIAGFLKDAPFYVQTQSDFLLQALARLCSRRSSNAGAALAKSQRNRRAPESESHRPFRRKQLGNTWKQSYEKPAGSHHNSSFTSERFSASFYRKKIVPVKRFAHDALAAETVLRRHGGAKRRFSASARLALPGRDVHGRAIDTNLYVAIGKLAAKLARLLRKRKTRLAKTFERPNRADISSELPTGS
jgi:ribosomal subunit interface protein